MAEALILLAAIAVDLACRVVPAQLPYLFPFIFNAPVFLGCWLTLLWYLRGLSRTAPPHRPGPVRRGFFLAGLTGIYFVLQTHFEYMAQHMFFLNRIQAVTLGMVAPFCIAIGWMPDVLRRGAPSWLSRACGALAATRAARFFSHLIPAMAVFLVTTDFWLIPAVHFAAMINPTLYAAMNLSCLAGGLLFWLVVLDPRPKPPARFSYLARGAAGFLVMFPQIAISSYIALTSRDLYSFYTLCGRLFPNISPAYDQMLGGLIQWIPPGMMNTAALIIGLNALRLADQKAEQDFVPPPGAKVYDAKWTGR
ncbi:MAG TPA: cytochrome c oxidase assembly protein [Acidocella sp.]|jgi:putative membrane protein|uniref:cytochrome c oxidase assembly protein n=1 Tax=Acidocella sp. TaxID=50710 RepID=UPI002C07A75A|nr:cytochrome c oxidase assembly protein [Acidocella sp.]HVE20574.1 cytochrome c oxidase assembly protein [Acidocella sp.]